MVKNVYPKNKLFSVVVITYNSASYVAETLESIKNQSYKDIELVICDDASTDKTPLICKDWIIRNETRFNKVTFLKNEVNLGIPGNCNRGLFAAKGEWIKFIAGDDALFENAIESVVSFSLKYPNIDLLSSSVAYFKDELIPKNLFFTRNDSRNKFYRLSANEQYKYLLYGNRVHALSVLCKKKYFIGK